MEQNAALQKFAASAKGKLLLKANKNIFQALVARFTSMTPEQQQSIKGIVTPQNQGALKILLPELAGLKKKGTTNGQ